MNGPYHTLYPRHLIVSRKMGYFRMVPDSLTDDGSALQWVNG